MVIMSTQQQQQQPPAEELSLALRAVHTASLLTKNVLRSLKNNVAAETKADDSPVTIADFAAQAIIIAALHAVYPADAFIGEESADALRQNEGLADRVWNLVLQAKEVAASTTSTGESQSSDVQAEHSNTTSTSTLYFPASKNEMLDVIDLGGKNTTTHTGRVWVLDPVDGTATFMQEQQYAVCLCLLVDGVQQVGVIGCPNLAYNVDGPQDNVDSNEQQQYRIHEDHVDTHGYGVVVSAVKGHGTHVRSMHASGLGDSVRRITLDRKSKPELSTLNFVESTLGKTSLSQPEHRAVAESLGAPWPGTVLWSQQMKYVALALGATDVMLRIPLTKARYTYVWDHAGGHICFEEAGGKLRDFDGGEIDFGQGRRIEGSRNWGMVACLPDVFADVEGKVKEVLGRRESTTTTNTGA